MNHIFFRASRLLNSNGLVMCIQFLLQVIAAKQMLLVVQDSTSVPKERFPYVVSLGACGGVLVDPRLVLTAGHCVEEIGLNPYVFIGPQEHAARGGSKYGNKVSALALRSLVWSCLVGLSAAAPVITLCANE